MTHLKLFTEGGDELLLNTKSVKAVLSCPIGSRIHVGAGFHFTVKLSPSQVVKCINYVDSNQSNADFIDSDQILSDKKDRIGF